MWALLEECDYQWAFSKGLTLIDLGSVFLNCFGEPICLVKCWREFHFHLLVSGSLCSHTSSWLAENSGEGQKGHLSKANNQGWQGGAKKGKAPLEPCFGDSTGVKCTSFYSKLAKDQCLKLPHSSFSLWALWARIRQIHSRALNSKTETWV